MESFKIHCLSVLNSVFLSYLFSNNFYMLSVNYSQSQSIQPSRGLWAWLWPAPKHNQTYKTEIIVFNSNILSGILAEKQFLNPWEKQLQRGRS